MLLALLVLACVPAAAVAKDVKHVGGISASPVSNGNGGCELATFFKWSELPGATSYTLTLDDTQGFGTGTTTFPPYNAEAEGPFAGNPPVAKGQHRIALTYQAGPCDSFADDASRFTVKKFTASYADDRARIVGSVTGDGGEPIGGVKISIRGPSSSTETTNVNGVFGTTVEEGRYTVEVESRYCLRGSPGKCKRSTKLDVKGTESVHFRRGEETVRLSGTVYVSKCVYPAFFCYGDMVPPASATVTATGQPSGSTGPAQYTASTDAQGNWSIKARTGQYTVVASANTSSVTNFSLTPTARAVEARTDRRGLDFCPSSPSQSGGWVGRCEIATLEGRVQDIDGDPYSPAFVAWGQGDQSFNGDSALVRNGRFRLLVPKSGRTEVHGHSVTENTRFLATGDVADDIIVTGSSGNPVFKFRPYVGGGFRSNRVVEVLFDKLPYRGDRNFTLVIERSREPTVKDVCTFERSFKFKGGRNDSHFGDDVYSRHQAYIEAFPAGGQLGSAVWCSGLYRLRLVDAEGKTLASDNATGEFEDPLPIDP